jgi:DNA-3-methyladenine glycosylase I
MAFETPLSGYCGEITGEFLIFTGYLPGADAPGCPVFEAAARLGPPWMRAE